MPAAGLFILIGAEPFTDWLPDVIARDRWGFVLTGPDVDRHGRWTGHRFRSRPACPACSPSETSATARQAGGLSGGRGLDRIRLVHEYLALP